MKRCFIVPEARAIADVVPWYGENEFLITRISVPRANRGLGFGTKLLSMITEEADRCGATLVLAISPSGGLTFEQLQEWYERYGFRQDLGTWRRSPRPKIPA